MSSELTQALERHMPGEHLVQHDPERVDIRTRVDGAGEGSCSGDMYLVVPTTMPALVNPDSPRTRAIRDLQRIALADHHVGRLDVTMDDALLMGGGRWPGTARPLKSSPAHTATEAHQHGPR